MEKKYKSSIKVKNEEDIKPFIASVSINQHMDWRDIIEDYIMLSRKRANNKLAMLYLQLNILRDIVVIESSIKSVVGFLNNPDQIKQYITDDIIVDERQIKFWEDQLHSNKIILSALKAVGDGILCRILDYNIPLLLSLSHIDSSGSFHLDNGRINELHSLGDEFYDHQKKSFIYNAITNIGRIADIIAKSKNGNIEFIEVKSSSKNHGTDQKERVEKQKNRLLQLENLANNGEGYVGEQKIRIKNVPGTPDLKLDVLGNIINLSEKEGISWGLLRPYVGVIVNNFTKLSNDKEKIDSKIDYSNDDLHQQLIKIDGDEVIIIKSISNIEFSRIILPYTIYPLEPEIIADVLMGYIIIEYFLNVNELFREISELGWTVKESILTNENLDPLKDPFCIISKGHWTITIPPSDINRIIFEGMSVNSLLNLSKHLDSRDKLNNDEVIVYKYENEKEVWN